MALADSSSHHPSSIPSSTSVFVHDRFQRIIFMTHWNPQEDALPRLPPRRPDAHKGDFGLALIVGGSRGMAGAAALAGMAALRGGAGLVRLAVPEAVLDTVAGFEPSYMTVPLPADAAGRIAAAAFDRIVELAEQATVVACGPGLGPLARVSIELVAAALSGDRQADGLRRRRPECPGGRAGGAGASRRPAHPHAAPRRVRPADRPEAGRRAAQRRGGSIGGPLRHRRGAQRAIARW